MQLKNSWISTFTDIENCIVVPPVYSGDRTLCEQVNASYPAATKLESIPTYRLSWLRFPVNSSFLPGMCHESASFHIPQTHPSLPNAKTVILLQFLLTLCMITYAVDRRLVLSAWRVSCEQRSVSSLHHTWRAFSSIPLNAKVREGRLLLRVSEDMVVCFSVKTGYYPRGNWLVTL